MFSGPRNFAQVANWCVLLHPLSIITLFWMCDKTGMCDCQRGMWWLPKRDVWLPNRDVVLNMGTIRFLPNFRLPPERKLFLEFNLPLLFSQEYIIPGIANPFAHTLVIIPRFPIDKLAFQLTCGPHNFFPKLLLDIITQRLHHRYL